MSDTNRYEATADPDGFLATLGEGVLLPVHRSRVRSYPGLPSAAPSTGAVYRVAARALVRSKALLDVGCGAGGGARLLVTPGRGVTGLDPSVEAIAFARASAPAVRFVEGTLAQLDPAERFDAATVVDVLGLLPEPVALLSALRAVLTEGGTVVVAEPRATLAQQLVPPARRAFTREALEAVLVRAGYRSEGVLASPAEFVMLSARPSPESLTMAALAASESEDTPLEAAIEQVSEALAAVADPVEARELLLAFGALHLRHRDYDSAAGTFVGVLRMAPDSARGLVGLGRVAEAVARPQEALRLYEKATVRDPLAPEGWTALGALRAREGELEGALAALAHAVALAPAEAAVVDAFAAAGGEHPAGTAARTRLAAYALASPV